MIVNDDVVEEEEIPSLLYIAWKRAAAAAGVRWVAERARTRRRARSRIVVAEV